MTRQTKPALGERVMDAIAESHATIRTLRAQHPNDSIMAVEQELRAVVGAFVMPQLDRLPNINTSQLPKAVTEPTRRLAELSLQKTIFEVAEEQYRLARLETITQMLTGKTVIASLLAGVTPGVAIIPKRLRTTTLFRDYPREASGSFAELRLCENNLSTILIGEDPDQHILFPFLPSPAASGLATEPMLHLSVM